MDKHMIYGLYTQDQPRNILYVGSTTIERATTRLEEHRQGKCVSTKLGAEKGKVSLSALEMRALRFWTSGEDSNPEHHVLELCQAFGLAQWNFRHSFSSAENRKGSRKANAISEKNNWEHQKKIASLGGRVGGQKTADLYGSEHFQEAGRKGGPIGARNQSMEDKLKGLRKCNHVRWHVNRGIKNPECELCKEE